MEQIWIIVISAVVSFVTIFLNNALSKDKDDADIASTLTGTALELVDELKEELTDLKKEVKEFKVQRDGLYDMIKKQDGRIDRLVKQVEEAGMIPVNGNHKKE